MQNTTVYRALKHNLVVNLLDGGFFGFAIGFASFSTVIPLFVHTLTGSATLIGLIPAIHGMGWMLPQLLTVKHVARQTRLKPTVLWMTINERLPFLGLALVAFLIPRLNSRLALGLTFSLLIWQGLGGGFTATAWQSMIGKIIPPNRRGTFFGAQSSAANGLASVSAIIAGLLLARLESPLDYTTCFILAALMMTVSWFFLAQTHEPENILPDNGEQTSGLWVNLKKILKRDDNFRWYLAVRILSQFGVMGFAFYTVYAVQRLQLNEVEIGVMTAVLTGSQIPITPLLGWIGDRWSNRTAMSMGLAAAAASVLLAWWAPSAGWFYLVFILAGVANAAVWTVSLSMTLEFGEEVDRPAYIGLANSLVAPFTILAPFLGGTLADLAGYSYTFLLSAFGALAALLALLVFMQDPRHSKALSEPISEDEALLS